MEQASPQPTAVPAPLGLIEPHAGLLRVPPDGQLLYKIMKVENFLRSIGESYLHFNRVDRYSDFPDADPNDGAQLPGDRPLNAAIGFAKNPAFKWADNCDTARARTYACSFSLENSAHIWKTYANGSAKGKICVVFDFAKLRARLNQTVAEGHLTCNGIRCRQIFSVNYGIVEYVPWDEYRANSERLANPITYTYMKSDRYRDEKELRVALSALSMGHYVLNDMSKIPFEANLPVSFDFRAAFADSTITEFVSAPDCDVDFLRAELDKLLAAV